MTTTGNGTTSTRRSTRSRSATASALDDVRARVLRDSDVDPKTKEAAKARRAKVKKDVAEMSIEKATSAVSAAKVKITQTLDSLNEEINGKLEELRLINESISLAQQDLQQLHDNDVVLSSTADLVAQHEATRMAWTKEHEEHEASVAERNRELEKARKREADDYNFNLAVKRRNDDQVFNEQIRVRNMQEQLRQEQFEKSIKEREAAMAAREQEFIALKQKVESFDVEVKKAVDEKMNTVVKAISRDHAVEVDKLNMQSASDKRMQELENANLRKAIDDKNAQIARLQNDLNEARQGITTLATSAMEASSGKQALNAVSQIQSGSGPAKK